MLAFAAEPAQTMALAQSVAGDDRGRDIEFAHPSDPTQIEQALRSTQPRLLLFDVRLAERFGMRAMLELRRRFSAPAWMLAGQLPAPRWTELIVLCQARGSIEWHHQPRSILRAIDAVLAGELWFSRATLKALYLALLDSWREAPVTPLGDASTGDGSGAPALTQREAETLALMRQGLSNKQIAQHLGISVNTVKKHLAHGFEKSGLHSRRQCFG